MFNRIVDEEEVCRLLDLQGPAELRQAIDAGLPTVSADEMENGRGYRLADIVEFALTRVLVGLGVSASKAESYSEAVLGKHMSGDPDRLLGWFENETQELYCILSDRQLARIFLRNKETGKEIEVGAEKPVLFPITRCEINVSRIVMPVLYRAKHPAYGTRVSMGA